MADCARCHELEQALRDVIDRWRTHGRYGHGMEQAIFDADRILRKTIGATR